MQNVLYRLQRQDIGVFLPYAEVEEPGGAITYVKTMLDDGSNIKEWQEYEKEQQQINLF